MGFLSFEEIESYIILGQGGRVHPDYQGIGLSLTWTTGPNVEEYRKKYGGRSFIRLDHSPATEAILKHVAKEQTVHKQWVRADKIFLIFCQYIKIY